MTSMFKMVRGRRAITVAALSAALAASLAVRDIHLLRPNFPGPERAAPVSGARGPTRSCSRSRPTARGSADDALRGQWRDNGSWSKDGSRIVFNRHWDPAGPNEKFILYTINADGTGAKALPKAATVAVEPELVSGRPPDHLPRVPSGRLKVMNADGTGLRSAGIPGVGGDSPCSSPTASALPSCGRSPATTLAAIFVARPVRPRA